MPEYRLLEGNPPRCYAIGDVHGCLPELEALLKHLREVEKVCDLDQLIFIGDFIDRGENSKQVIEKLIAVKQEMPSAIFLKGNHEDMLLAYLGLPGRGGDVYLFNGGKETLVSYGVGPEATPAELSAAIPAAHMDFFNALEKYVVSEHWIFVHAGLDPLRSMHSQREDDLFWIRDEFIFNIHFFGRTVIFGHTPYEDVLFHEPYKIGIDTGLVYGNKLSCIELTSRRILQVAKGQTKVVVREFPEGE